MGATAQADILFELGMMYATGRDCDTDLVAAHKWFNIAAIKGSARAAELRSELSADDVEGRDRQGAARSARMDDDALNHRRNCFGSRPRKTVGPARTRPRKTAGRPRTRTLQAQRPSCAGYREASGTFGRAGGVGESSMGKSRDRPEQGRRGFWLSRSWSTKTCGRPNRAPPMRLDRRNER